MARIKENTAISFIKWHFPEFQAMFSGLEYEDFNDLISRGKDIAAAEEYYKLNGIDEAHFAVQLAKSLKQ